MTPSGGRSSSKAWLAWYFMVDNMWRGCNTKTSMLFPFAATGGH
jgi:hypothetical protein